MVIWRLFLADAIEDREDSNWGLQIVEAFLCHEVVESPFTGLGLELDPGSLCPSPSFLIQSPTLLSGF